MLSFGGFGTVLASQGHFWGSCGVILGFWGHGAILGGVVGPFGVTGPFWGSCGVILGFWCGFRVMEPFGACRAISGILEPFLGSLRGHFGVLGPFGYLRLRRKVDQGRMRTRCPIMDILCSVGCRLKMTMSPSHMCRSTWGHSPRHPKNPKPGGFPLKPRVSP